MPELKIKKGQGFICRSVVSTINEKGVQSAVDPAQYSFKMLSNDKDLVEATFSLPTPEEIADARLLQNEGLVMVRVHGSDDPSSFAMRDVSISPRVFAQNTKRMRTVTGVAIFA